MSIVLFLVSLVNYSEIAQPQDIKGLFKWNVAEIGLVAAIRGGFCYHGEFLQFSYTLVKPRFGFGVSALDAYVTFDTGYYIALPLQINALIWCSKRGLFGSFIVGKLNGFCNFGFLASSVGMEHKKFSLNLGLEYTPGTLLNLRFGYLTRMGDPWSSGLYASIGVYLGAVHGIR